MPTEFIKRSLALVMIPMLIATAAIAQDTQDTPAEKPNSGTQEDPVIAQANRDKARAEALKATADAQKAAREANVAAAGSLFGPLSSYTGATGATTVDPTNRGALEATLLSSLAMQEAVEPLARDVAILARRSNEDGSRRLAYGCPDRGAGARASDSCDAPPALAGLDSRNRPSRELCEDVNRLGAVPPMPRYRPLVVVSEDAQGPAALAETFEVQTAGMARELCRALAESEALLQRDATARGMANEGRERAAGFSPAAVGAAVNTVASLLRTDYTIYGIALQPEQNQLVRELAGALLARNLPNPVYTPGLFPVGPTTDDNPALQRVSLLEALRSQAANATAAHAELMRSMAQRVASLRGPALQALNAQKGDHERMKARLDEAIKAYTTLINELTSRQDGQPPALAGIIRQAHTAALLRQGGLLVVTKIHFQGGTAFTRQNFFSSLFGMPYRVSGGALVSSIVQDGRTGQVYQTEVVPVSGGFYGPTQIRRAIEEARARRQARRTDAER
jgi:hypothetical protein